jgi:hypothetical protein
MNPLKKPTAQNRAIAKIDVLRTALRYHEATTREQAQGATQ